jgi:hypothetical protein
LRITLLLVTLALPALDAQQLLDRVLAHVDGNAITLTDLNAAAALGIVQPDGLQELIDRQLMLTEVARFSPPEPDRALVEKEVAAMTARAGGRLDDVMDATGIDEARIQDMARDTLRIAAYLTQRFGTDQSTIQQWLEGLRTRANIVIRN